jgi:putative FmdB family regulatory protein
MTYEYVCTACAHAWEAEQSINDAALKTCPNCHQETAKRQVSGGAGFILKGGGWYADLYGSAPKKGPSEEAKPAKADAKPAAESTSGDAGSKSSDSGSKSTDGGSKSPDKGSSGSSGSSSSGSSGTPTSSTPSGSKGTGAASGA